MVTFASKRLLPFPGSIQIVLIIECQRTILGNAYYTWETTTCTLVATVPCLMKSRPHTVDLFIWWLDCILIGYSLAFTVGFFLLFFSEFCSTLSVDFLLDHEVSNNSQSIYKAIIGLFTLQLSSIDFIQPLYINSPSHVFLLKCFIYISDT